MTELDALATSLGYSFTSGELLLEAVTHRSWAFERGEGESSNYERLELLGDAVLGLLATEWLFERYRDFDEGRLAKLKSHLVSEPVLAAQARQLGLGAAIRLGVGEERSGGRDKDSILADVFEAVLGALYLDGGLEPARALATPLLEEEAARPAARFGIDAKTALQERLQAAGWDLPEYHVTDSVGPDHRKTFVVQTLVQGELMGIGEGPSKKKAQQAAALSALERLSILGRLS